jgi:hypothetical protein
MCLWNIAPLATQQEVLGVRGAEAPPLAGELSSPSAFIPSHPHRLAVTGLCHPRRAEVIIDRLSSSAMERRQGRARPATMERRHHPLATTLEGRPHPCAVPWEVRHHLARAAAIERHPHLWAAAIRYRVHHRQRRGALISGLVVTATSRSRSRRSRMKIRLLFIWFDWILLLFFACKMLVFSLCSSDSLIRSDSKLQTGLSSVFFWYLRNQRNGLSVYNEFIPREYTHNTIFIRNNTIQIQTTQMHAYALITHDDGSMHHSSNYNDILLASTITAHTTTITTYY